jgi:hypothetical protein
MERLATKILTLIDDIRWSRHDLDYLAWQIVYQSPRPIRKRVAILAEAITFHINNDKEDNDYGADTIF